jgi:hypothetical protein
VQIEAVWERGRGGKGLEVLELILLKRARKRVFWGFLSLKTQTIEAGIIMLYGIINESDKYGNQDTN